jgi:hypothetical protein
MSRGYSPAINYSGRGSIPDQVMWDLWWTKCNWGMLSASTPVILANNSTNYSTLIIIDHPELVQ